MDHRSLGHTGLSLSVIGFGAFKIGRNVGIKYIAGYELPSDVATERLLNGILDLGINYIDTAPAYGESEARIGRFLFHRRHQFIISTKVGEVFQNGISTYNFNSAAVEQSIETSLVRLRTDHVDLIFVHSDGDDLNNLHNTDVVSCLQRARDRGLTRFIGFSGKTIQGAIASLDWADAIMIEYHPSDVSQSPAIEAAMAAGVGVIVKKPLASGCLRPSQAIPFILGNQGVTSMVIGGLSLEHFRQNIDASRNNG